MRAYAYLIPPGLFLFISSISFCSKSHKKSFAIRNKKIDPGFFARCNASLKGLNVHKHGLNPWLLNRKATTQAGVELMNYLKPTHTSDSLSLPAF